MSVLTGNLWNTTFIMVNGWLFYPKDFSFGYLRKNILRYLSFSVLWSVLLRTVTLAVKRENVYFSIFWLIDWQRKNVSAMVSDRADFAFWQHVALFRGF